MVIKEINAPNGTVFIHPPENATFSKKTLEENENQNIYRLEWSHGLICILTDSKVNNDVNPIFNYSVLNLGNGDYAIDYNHKNPNFVDRKY